MPSHTMLIGLPIEVMENMVTLLDFQDICSFRLTSGELATKSQHPFKRYLRTKTIIITVRAQLEEFVLMTQPKQLGSVVEHLTLAIIPRNGAQDAAEPLTRALKNLRINSTRGALRSLSLEVVTTGSEGNGGRPDLRSIWEAAEECFQTAAIALAASRLPTEALNIFGPVAPLVAVVSRQLYALSEIVSPSTPYSLACGRISPVLEMADLAPSLHGVKQLSIRLSHHQLYVQGPESDEMKSFTAGERNTNAISQFLGLCPQLEDLNLNWYNSRVHGLEDAFLEEKHFFKRIADSFLFPSLKRCALKGISTSEIALLTFLNHVHLSLSSLEMEELHLHAGTFRPVFTFLAQCMEHLEHLHMDDLFETGLIHFDAPGEPHFNRSIPTAGPNTLTRTGADARRLIKYHIGQGRPLGSAKAAIWYRRRRLLYGPPV